MLLLFSDRRPCRHVHSRTGRLPSQLSLPQLPPSSARAAIAHVHLCMFNRLSYKLVTQSIQVPLAPWPPTLAPCLPPVYAQLLAPTSVAPELPRLLSLLSIFAPRRR